MERENEDQSHGRLKIKMADVMVNNDILTKMQQFIVQGYFKKLNQTSQIKTLQKLMQIQSIKGFFRMSNGYPKSTIS